MPDLPPAECGARLAALFPALFSPGAAKPLKLRIQADIQQRAPGIFTKKSLSVFLHRYTTSTAYLRSMVAAPHRTDLDGAPSGELADEHRQAATVELERRGKLHEERRAAEREVQRKAEDERRKALQAQWPVRRAPGATGDGADAAGAAGTAGASGPRDAGDARGARPPMPARPRPPPDPRREAPDAARPYPRPDASRRSADASRQPPDEHRPRRDEPRRAPEALRKSPDPLRQRHNEFRTASPEPSASPLVEDPGRRERALLLRAFESTTLTRANFCVLKRMTETELDAVLVQARQEAPAAPPEFRPVPNRQRR